MKGRDLGIAQGLQEASTNRRADAYLEMQQQNQAVGTARARREQETDAAGKEGLPGFIYGAISGADPQQVLGEFNQFGNMRLKNYTVNQDSSISMTGEDGQTATIPANTVAGFMQKFRGIDLRSKTGTASTAYDKGTAIQALGQYYDVSDLSAPEKAALADGAMKGVPFDQIGTELGLKPKLTEESNALAILNTKIEDQERRIAKGDTKHWGKSRAGILADLKKERTALEAKVGSPKGVTMRTRGLSGGAPPEEPPADPINSQGDTVAGLSQRNPMNPRGEDLNGDGKVDELDKEYAYALRVTELMKNPAARKQLEGRFTALKLAEFESTVKAVQKHLGRNSTTRVQSTLK